MNFDNLPVITNSDTVSDEYKPTFFVFTCIKDGRKYIRKLLDSILYQTKVNFVHYIYDDGSVENIDDIILEYKDKIAKLKQPFIFWYEKNSVNIGLNKATEHCIRKVNLPYFMWMNCDDWYDRNFFRMAEKYIVKHNTASIIRSNTKNVFDHKKHNTPTNYFYKKKQFLKTNQYIPFISGHIYKPHFIVKTDDFIKVNRNIYLDDNRLLFNDNQIYYPFAALGKEFGYIKHGVTYFLSRNGSESHTLCIDYQDYSPIFNYLGISCESINQKKCIDSFNKQIKFAIANRDCKNLRNEFRKKNEYLKKYGFSKNDFRFLTQSNFFWVFTTLFKRMLHI